MIRLSDISKAYGSQKVFDNFSLEIENGKILCVLGESGGGKTTLLNILAGLARSCVFDSFRTFVDGRTFFVVGYGAENSIDGSFRPALEISARKADGSIRHA